MRIGTRAWLSPAAFLRQLGRWRRMVLPTRECREWNSKVVPGDESTSEEINPLRAPLLMLKITTSSKN